MNAHAVAAHVQVCEKHAGQLEVVSACTALNRIAAWLIVCCSSHFEVLAFLGAATGTGTL